GSVASPRWCHSERTPQPFGTGRHRGHGNGRLPRATSTETFMRISRVVASLGILALAVVPAARAQYPQRREGFWIGFGLGYGSADISCDNCDSGPRTGGVTGFLKLGGTPSRNVLIGGSLNGWSHSRGGATETMGNITGSLYYYPVATSGLFLSGGLGFSNYHVDTSPSTNGTGWGFTGGVGYD